MSEEIIPMVPQSRTTMRNQEAVAALRPVTKSSLGLGAAVLAGLAVAAGVAAPAAAATQDASAAAFNIVEVTGMSTTCCPGGGEPIK